MKTSDLTTVLSRELGRDVIEKTGSQVYLISTWNGIVKLQQKALAQTDGSITVSSHLLPTTKVHRFLMRSKINWDLRSIRLKGQSRLSLSIEWKSLLRISRWIG